MAYKPRHLMTLFLPALLLAGLAVSCTDTDILPDADAPSIDFGTPALTRGVVTSDADMDAFDVWGWYKLTGGSETATDTLVFNATPVTKKGDSWKYDNPQRWQPGNTYRFYAMYPSGQANIQLNSNGDITISGFDCFEDVDLMVAAKENVDCLVGQLPGRISMPFIHLLTSIEFVGKIDEASADIDDFSARIVSASLGGMCSKGDFKGSIAVCQEDKDAIRDGWNFANYTAEAPFDEVVYSTDDGKLTTDGVSIFGEILLFPQYVKQGLYFEITYEVNGVGREPVRIDLTSLPLSEWQAGMRYRYSFTVSDSDRILFDVPTVNPWEEATGGIIIVE